MINDDLWDQDRLGIEWISLSNYDLETMTTVIIQAVKDQSSPKNILIMSYQKFFGIHDVQVIVKHLERILEAVKGQKQNTVAFGTGWFVPSQQDIWGQVAIFNEEVYRLSEIMDRPRANTHKYLMRQVSRHDDTRMVRPNNWVEKQLGLHIGTTLSWEGQQRLKQCIIKIFDFNFANNVYRPPSSPVETKIPPTLENTPGYLEDEFMTQVLLDKGFISPRPRGRRLRCSESRCPIWRSFHIFRTHGPMWSFESREGMLEAYLMMMRRSHTIEVWDQYVPAENNGEEPVQSETVKPAPAVPNPVKSAAVEPEKVKPTAVAQEPTKPIIDRMANASIRSNDELSDDDYDPEVFNISSDEFMDIHQVTLDESTDSVFLDNSIGEKEKKTDRNEMESKLADLERSLKVTEEKLKGYRREAENKETLIIKEKAATKHFKQLFDKERERSEELLGSVEKEQKATRKLLGSIEKEQKATRQAKRQSKRLAEEYDYLRGVYESEHGKYGKPLRRKVKLQFAKISDFDTLRKSSE